MRALIVFVCSVLALLAFSVAAQPGGASALAGLQDGAPTEPAEGPDASEPTSPLPEGEEAPNDAAAASTDESTVDAGTDGGEETTEAEPTVGDIVKQGGEVYDIWRSQGWVAGLAALIYLLVQVTKFGIVKSWLGVRKWLRPLIALVLGLAGSVVASVAGGVVWWSALLGGLAAAFGSSGFNELLNAVTPTGRDKRTG